MLTNDITPAMTSEELITGETRHSATEHSRKLAMTAGLTKSSDELSRAWEKDPELYLSTLKAAIAAYDDNKSLEELLVSAVARLVSVVDGGGGGVVERAVEIVSGGRTDQAS